MSDTPKITYEEAGEGTYLIYTAGKVVCTVTQEADDTWCAEERYGLGGGPVVMYAKTRDLAAKALLVLLGVESKPRPMTPLEQKHLVNNVAIKKFESEQAELKARRKAARDQFPCSSLERIHGSPDYRCGDCGQVWHIYAAENICTGWPDVAEEKGA